MPNEINFIGVKLTISFGDEIFEEIFRDIAQKRKFSLACMNVYSFRLYHDNARYREALSRARYVVVDGAGLRMVSALLGTSIGKRVTGYDIFFQTLKKLDERGGSCFFLGSTPEVLGAISKRVKKEYPNIAIAGVHAPPYTSEFTDDQIHEMALMINACRPDIVWVGLSAPKQEIWIDGAFPYLDNCSLFAVGAVFDFFAGTIKRAPKIFIYLGLEWLHRFLMNPKKMAVRLKSIPWFLKYVVINNHQQRSVRK